MGIFIQNISKKFSEKGIQEYVIKINNKEICKFKHKRSDGLGVCLIKAGFAVAGHKPKIED